MNVTIITRKIRRVRILLTWIIPLEIFAPILSFSRIDNQPDGLYLCKSDIGEFIIHPVVNFRRLYCAPLVFIIILNSRIIKFLRKADPVIHGNDHSIARHKQNQRITKVLLSIGVIFFFFICWTSRGSFSFRVTQKDFTKRHTRNTFYFMSLFSSILQYCFNPLVLFTFSTHYRQALKDCLLLAVFFTRANTT